MANEEIIEEVEDIVDIWQKVGEEIGHTLKKVLDGLREILTNFMDSLEPYQKFEALHPRKKPRGSIRRRRRRRRRRRTKTDENKTTQPI